MGWTFSEAWPTKADLVRHLTGPGYGGECLRCLRHALRGNVLWTIHERYKADGSSVRFIGCFLLRRDRDCGWGYKDMDESMGPYYYTCPLSFLDDTPCSGVGYSREWREKVREYRARLKATAPVVGHYAKVGNRYMRIVSVRPLLAVCDGTTYRLPRRYIDRVLPPEAVR